MSSVALTSPFTPSPSCLSDVYLTTTGFLGYMSLGPPQPAQCFPSAWQPTSQYFSPGVCPSGYQTACVYKNGLVTEATCCPSYYSCQTSTNWPQYSTMPCTVQVSDLPSAPASITSGTSVMPIGLNAGGGINAFGLSIRWKAGDFTTTLSSSTPSTSLQSPTSTTQSSSASSNSSASTSPITTSSKSASSAGQSNSISSSTALSTSAKAGIGIGAAVLALAIISILVFFIMRYQRAHSVRDAHELSVGETSQWQPGKWGSGAGRKYWIANNGFGPVELHHEVPPAELYGERIAVDECMAG